MKIIGTITAALVLFLCGAASTGLTTAWMNDDVKAHGDWDFARHVEQHGKHAIYGSRFSPLWFHMGVGTNRHLVELGMRSDGTVVWRRKGDVKD